MLADEPQTFEIFLGSAGANEEIADHIRREGVTGAVVVDDDPTTIEMAIDTLTALPFREWKAIT